MRWKHTVFCVRSGGNWGVCANTSRWETWGSVQTVRDEGRSKRWALRFIFCPKVRAVDRLSETEGLHRAIYATLEQKRSIGWRHVRHKLHWIKIIDCYYIHIATLTPDLIVWTTAQLHFFSTHIHTRSQDWWIYLNCLFTTNLMTPSTVIKQQFIMFITAATSSSSSFFLYLSLPPFYLSCPWILTAMLER